MKDAVCLMVEPEPLYASLISLKEAHLQLLKRYRAEEGDAVIEDVKAFLRKGAASGALLDSDPDRASAQSLLDYWVTVLYRSEHIPPDATLAEFDPSLAPELPDSLCPYVGLNPFEEGDKENFFGRRRLLENMLNELKERRLLAIIGPSGSGKSSLVLAGLVPALKNGALDGSSTWRYFPRLVPGSDPLKSLARAIKPSDRDLSEWAEQQSALLRQDPGHLVKVVAEISETPAVIVVDQFEEVYTLCYDEAAQQLFAENLARFAKAPDRGHRVLLTMRTDFEQKLALLPALLPLFQEQGVKVGGADLLISAADLREAIEEPAKRIGLQFEDGVIDQLVKDILGEAAGLPLLQFTLLKLWKNREHNRITWNGYKSLGSARQALTIAADQFYSGLIPQDQQTAKRILLRLARPSAGVEITSNRLQREALYKAGEARDQVDRVLTKLLNAGLLHLTKGDTPAYDQIEVSHEALIRNWGMFVTWLEEERETLRKRVRLSEAAEQWRMQGKESGELLRGSRLEDARRYEDLNSLESEFVAASLNEKEAERRREQEADRSKVRAELEATNARKFRNISIGLLVVSVILILAIFQIVVLEKMAEREAAILKFRDMVAKAIKDLDIDPEASVLVALRAADQASADADKSEINEAADALSRALSVSRAEGFLPTGVDPATRRAIVAYNQQGTRLATLGGEGNVVQIWDIDTGRLYRSLEGKDELFRTLVFAPEGNLLFTTSNKSAEIWDCDAEPVKPRIIVPLSTGVERATFSADGKRIATAEHDGTLKLWDASTGNRIGGLENSKHEGVTSLSFSSDGKYLATGNAYGTVAIWNIATGKERFDNRLRHNDAVMSVRFSPNGKLLATASQDETVKIWNAENGTELDTLVDHTNSVFDLAFSPDGKRIVTGSADCTAKVYDIESGRQLSTLAGHRLAIWGVAFGPDANHVATASWDGTVRVWNVGRVAGRISSAAFSEDGRRLATRSPGSNAAVWDAETSEALLYEPVPTTGAIALSGNGNRMAIGNQDGKLMIYDLGKLKFPPVEALGPVVDLELNRDGNSLASLTQHKAILWDLATGISKVHEMPASYVLRSLALSDDGRRVAIGDADGTIQIWDSATGIDRELSGKTMRGDIEALAFSLDSQLLASGSGDGYVRLWDAATGKEIGEPMQHGSYVMFLCFSRDGKHLVTTGLNGTVKIWDATSQLLLLHTLEGHSNAVEKAAFSSDGNRLATASWDKTARVWEVASGKQLLELTHSSIVKDIGFSTDGTRLTTVSADGMIREYYFDSEKLKELAKAHINKTLGRLTREEWNKYLEEDFSP